MFLLPQLRRSSVFDIQSKLHSMVTVYQIYYLFYSIEKIFGNHNLACTFSQHARCVSPIEGFTKIFKSFFKLLTSVYRQLEDLARGEGQLGEVPVEGGASWGTLTCSISWVYQQLGASNSQWHKKTLQKVPVGGSASLGKCKLGEDHCLTATGNSLPTGSSPNWHFPQLAFFGIFFCTIENLSLQTAVTPLTSRDLTVGF